MIIDTSVSSDYIEGEEELLDLTDITSYCDYDFSGEIIKRGEEYFSGEKVISCVQYGTGSFVGKVKGSYSNIYSVSFDIDEDGENPIYHCTCPCTYPCKHVYALLLAIENGKYSITETKPEIQMNEKSLKEIIELIPASELKEYIMTSIELGHVNFDMDFFNNIFNKYLPLQSYEYYYNKLYNSVALEQDFLDLTDKYFDSIKQYISDQNFQEAFKIIKVIVEVYAECNKLYINELVDLFPKIGMYLRIVYRKGNDKLKFDVNNWKDKLESVEYYKNYYLEDVFLTIGV